ncbi:MAG: hypothetical protein M1820_006172 [Bogoriella megaspora]|nr:MAG: hypothetical protein M1820_006172 [Bogoriella megaspora]
MSSISKSVFKKFLDAMPFGERIWPSRTSKNDAKFNFRADKGSTLADGRKEVVFQANKNADDQGVRESAQTDSHKIVAKVVVDASGDPQGSNVNQDALESFDENN